MVLCLSFLNSIGTLGAIYFSAPIEWVVNVKSISLLLITGAAIGLANAAWTAGMISGNVTLLATLFLFYSGNFYGFFIPTTLYSTLFFILARRYDGDRRLFNLLVSDSSKNDKKCQKRANRM